VSENFEEVKREKVRVVPLKYVDDFPDHPFRVHDDESMADLVHSIEMNGVMNPVIARRKEDGRYELISGHRRKFACEKLGLELIPIIVRELSRDDAIIAMVDSNLHREHILPSEKAKAYKMKMDAMKRQGKRTDLTSAPLVQKLDEQTSRAAIAFDNGESREQVRRYIRLNELTPKLLDLVDEGKIGFRPAVELSYLTEEEQKDLLETIESEEATPSLAQAMRMKDLSKNCELDMDAIFKIMTEEKGNQKMNVKIPMERLDRYFTRGTPPKEIEDVIIKALEFYRKRVREERDAR
jgi:ParB family chromosome partitioning protein